MPSTTINENNKDFSSITLQLASPDRIREWSYGEVTKPETINYRTGRSERGGLFDERIFGPEKDYECYCGKYKRIRYKGIVCEKCGVEVTRSVVRRERMGHIELASPVAHIWFLRGIPSRIGAMLNLSISELEKVIYFAGYIVTSVQEDERNKILKQLDNEYKMRFKDLKTDEDREGLKEALSNAKTQLQNLRPWQVLDELTYHRMSLKYGTVFEASIGAQAIDDIFASLDLAKMEKEVEAQLPNVSAVERVKLQKRFNLIKSLRRASVRPEWMFLKVIPVIPPALRPMVALDGGRHATSDVNDLYRRVINRNNRLKKLIDLRAPDVILRNEKRILQEAVDALIDNSIRKAGESAMSQAQRRPLKSLADSLRGKQGRFRQNLLGKRVDYSGRSVIVVGPELKLSQCGLPKHMALELFRPFVIAEVLAQELAFNIRGAGRLIDEGIPEVWAILEDVIKDKRVFLNRAPTLHRLGIQAFQPVLIEGNAIQLHPLVCPAFNADFDGDQMAVHVPLSAAAQKEAREIIASNKNLLKPGSGDPIVSMRMDIVLGCFWVTKIMSVREAGAELKVYPSPNAAIMAYDFDELTLQEPIKLVGGKESKYGELSGKIFETTVGRILFNSTLPGDFPFMNKEMTGGEMNEIVNHILDKYPMDEVPDILDKIKSFGFKFASKSGVTWGLDDVMVPAAKKGIIDAAWKKTHELEDQFEEGLLSEAERYRLFIEIWTHTRGEIEKIIPTILEKNSSVSDMVVSKARGSYSQVTQLVGMKGLIMSPTGRQIDFPVVPSYKEGLSPLEYFITTHGSRKGLADTALNTARAGYLTRKLVDVAQDVVITLNDCMDTEGKHINESHILGFDSGIGNSIKGRILLDAIKTADGQELFPKGHLISRTDADLIESHNIKNAHIRTPLTCKAERGVCQTCYGTDPGRSSLIKIGEPVGIVAAQAIGEPGTQLTMRTKHAGGVGSAGGDIVGGLPRVEELFERRKPKGAAQISEIDGSVVSIRKEEKEQVIEILVDLESRKKNVKSGTIEYSVSPARVILVNKGDNIKKGQLLTDGSVDLLDYYKLAGKQAVEDYIIQETNAIYQLQGVAISRKHIELIIRQMFSRRKVKSPGDTRFRIGEIVENIELVQENKKVEDMKGTLAEGDQVVLGISEVALTTSSFLSSVSFQHATRILIDTAIKGGVDHLRGLKENVIIGRLIPAGTGLIKNYSEDAEAESPLRYEI